MKKTRRFLCLLLTLVLALSLCAIPAAAADDQTRSDDPVVFVHGLFGWGQRDKIFRIMPYWGMTTGSLPDYLGTQGYETYAASVGPLSSAWDRACELYAQLVGARTDYGVKHAQDFGHERYGIDYETPLFDGWGTERAVNLVGHSFGGATARLFLEILTNGCPEEVAAAKAAGVEPSPFFLGGKGGWVHSLTAIAAPHNGTTFIEANSDFTKLAADLTTAAAKALGLSSLKGVYDFQLDQFGIRKDDNDSIFKTKREKYNAILKDVIERHEKGQPVLLGTISVEDSEILSRMLKMRNIPHNVLNAKNHQREAEIVARAGQVGAVTVATNMAGRGTDIMLGGNAEYMAKNELRKQGLSDELIAESNSFAETEDPEILAARAAYTEAYKRFKVETDKQAELVRQAGGLFIIGTERHESRRIDNQLRGRSGRQGDPGETRFYLSMQDDIMRLFGSERIMNMMETLGIDEDTPIDAKILSGAIENAQKTVEGRNFQSRKNVLEYDDVMNVQRKIIYEQRRQVLDGEDLQKNIQSMMRFYVDTYVASAFGEQPKLADKQHFFEMMTHFEPIFFPTGTWLLSDEELAALTREQAEEKILSLMQRAYAKREEQFTSPVMREIERVVTLRVVDEFWMDHIDAMDDLRQGIRLRAYAQTDPVIEYKREGFDMFEAMNDAIKEEIVRRVFLVRIKTNEEIKRQRVAKVTGEGAGGDKTVKRQPVVKKIKVGPNDPCPCGSGKKYKKCCRDKDLAAERGQNAN